MTARPTLRAIPPRLRAVLPSRQEGVLLLLLVGLLLAAGHISPPFLDPSTQTELSTHVWELALLALPMTLIITTGGIDLSVGSTMALCAVVFGIGFRAGLPVTLDALLALLIVADMVVRCEVARHYGRKDDARLARLRAFHAARGGR